jgi:hypothetical protein
MMQQSAADRCMVGWTGVDASASYSFGHGQSEVTPSWVTFPSRVLNLLLLIFIWYFICVESLSPGLVGLPRIVFNYDTAARTTIPPSMKATSTASAGLDMIEELYWTSFD